MSEGRAKFMNALIIFGGGTILIAVIIGLIFKGIGKSKADK